MAARGAWIFVNGDLADPAAVRAMVAPEDLLVAADGGLTHMRRLGLKPEIAIGDMDSITADDQRWLVEAGIPVEQYPPEKDETDLELALLWTLAAGAQRIRIAAAHGGRLDHTLGNLFLLMLPQLEGLDVRLENGREQVFLIRSSSRILGSPGDRVSLLPLGKPARGITTRGLEYPLRDETLWPERTRGISNVMLAEEAEVTVADGTLICIHTRLRLR